MSTVLSGQLTGLADAFRAAFAGAAARYLACTADTPFVYFLFVYPPSRSCGSPADEADGGGDKQVVPDVAERGGPGELGGEDSADPAGFLHQVACEGTASRIACGPCGRVYRCRLG